LFLFRCSETSEVFESCMGDWGDVEQLMNRLQVCHILTKVNIKVNISQRSYL